MDVSALTTDELNTYIKARLAVAGVDLSLLPTEPDGSGAPTQAQAMATLRSFVSGVPGAINSWRPAAASPALGQELAPPLEYPSITEAWTGKAGR